MNFFSKNEEEDSSPKLPEEDFDELTKFNPEEDFDGVETSKDSTEKFSNEFKNKKANTPLGPKFRNPGKFGDMENELQSVMTTMDIKYGFNLDYNRQTANFLVGHSVSMGPNPSTYSLLMQYFEQRFLMLGRVNTEGEFMGILNQPLTSGLNLHVLHQHNPTAGDVTEVETAITQPDATTTLKLQFHNQMPSIVASYNQAITPALSIGCEGQVNLVMKISALSGGFKFQKGKCVLSGQVSKQPFGPYVGHLNFMRRVANVPGNQIKYGTQLKLTHDQQTDAYKTNWCVAWDYKLQLASVKGNIDCNGRIHAQLEQKITPYMSLTLGGMTDFWNNKANFGIGVQVVLQEMSEEQQMMMQQEMEQQMMMQQEMADAEQGGKGAGVEGDEEFVVPKKQKTHL